MEMDAAAHAQSKQDTHVALTHEMTSHNVLKLVVMVET